MMKKYTLYMHKNKRNGKVYIGITTESVIRRWQNGWGYSSQPLFYNAIMKYGWDGFEHIILAENLSKEDACTQEMKLIEQYRSYDREFGYNRDLGGYAPGRVSEETKAVLREKNIGKKMSEESKRKMSEAKKGRTLPEEQRRKIGERSKGKPTSAKQKEVARTRMMGNKIWLGRSHSDETKEKIRQRHLGRNMSDEWRRKLSESHKGLLVGERNPKSKVVRCVETGEVFPTITAAGKSVGITHSRIRECCLGNRKTAKGFHWEYVNTLSENEPPLGMREPPIEEK